MTTVHHRVNPGSPIGALVEVDDWLAVIVPNYEKARGALVDLQPGTSGRPTGTGEPAGGSSVFTHSGPRASASVVERTIEHQSIERAALVELAAAPVSVYLATRRVVPTCPSPAAGRELVWSRWAVRQVLATDRAGSCPRLDRDAVNTLHQATHRLHDLVQLWAAPPRKPTKDEQRVAAELTVDSADDGCSSHRRINEWVTRSDRYPTLRLCRQCGDFYSANGFLPSGEILEHWREGRRVRMDMVDRARPVKKKRRK
jgi:hypothetical protein